MTSRFKDAPLSQRCTADVRLKDGSGAQCGRYRKLGHLCRQHYRIKFQCCGGNDEKVPGHTADCERGREAQEKTK